MLSMGRIECGDRGGSSGYHCAEHCKHIQPSGYNYCVNDTPSIPITNITYLQQSKNKDNMFEDTITMCAPILESIILGRGNLLINIYHCIRAITNAIYNMTTKCPDNCEYDNGICKSKNSGICEPMVYITCPHNLFIADTLPKDVHLKYEMWGDKYSYPLRLSDKFSKIMCTYSNDGNCGSIFVRRTCCNLS